MILRWLFGEDEPVEPVRCTKCTQVRGKNWYTGIDNELEKTRFRGLYRFDLTVSQDRWLRRKYPTYYCAPGTVLCTKCDGDGGKVGIVDNTWEITEICTECDGEGYVACSDCKGTGWEDGIKREDLESDDPQISNYSDDNLPLFPSCPRCGNLKSNDPVYQCESDNTQFCPNCADSRSTDHCPRCSEWVPNKKGIIGS